MFEKNKKRRFSFAAKMLSKWREKKTMRKVSLANFSKHFYRLFANWMIQMDY